VAVTTVNIADYHWYVPQFWPWDGLSPSPPSCYCQRPPLSGLHFCRSGRDKYTVTGIGYYLENIRSIGVIGETVDDILDLFLPVPEGFKAWAVPTTTEETAADAAEVSAAA
jgi:hypothetical protein